MSRRKPLAKIKICRSGASNEPARVHYRAAPGQNYVSTLCGWDERYATDSSTDGAVDCPECLAIVAYARGVA